MNKIRRKVIGFVAALCVATPSFGQSLIRDAEIENSLLEIAEPLLEVSGLQFGGVDRARR